MEVCAVENCIRRHYGRGLCKSHYNYYRKNGRIKRQLQIGIKGVTKWCPRCKQYLIFDAFNKNRRGVRGLNSYCKSCAAAKAVEKYYKLGEFAYDELLKGQNGLCAICKQKASGNGSDLRLHVDHCHTTNKIRGLLCGTCNRGLGLFKENEIFLESAVRYLRKYDYGKSTEKTFT